MTNGTATSAPDNVQKFVTVYVGGDTLHERDEMFFVKHSRAMNAVTAKGQDKGAIQNNDLQALSWRGCLSVAE